MTRRTAGPGELPSISIPTFLLIFFVFEIVEVYHTKMHPLFVSAMVATMMVTTTTLACPMENTEGVELPPFHLPVLDKDLYATPNGHVTDIAGGKLAVGASLKQNQMRRSGYAQRNVLREKK